MSAPLEAVRETRSERVVSSGAIEVQSRNKTPTAMVRTPVAAELAEEYTIKVKGITPRYPETDVEMVQLEEDSDRMGCLNLLNRPWGLKSEYMSRK